MITLPNLYYTIIIFKKLIKFVGSTEIDRRKEQYGIIQLQIHNRYSLYLLYAKEKR